LVTVEQVPVVLLQDMHVPVQVVLQQWPSTQLLLAHWPGPVHVCPSLSRHVPAPLQVFLPVQVSASSALVTEEQVPVAQVWQVPVQAELQHRPSTHRPEEHMVPVVQTCPCLATHIPVPLQVLLPVQVSASSALVTEEQVPVAQVWQLALHAVLQQCPSTQAPVAQSVPAVHTCPVFFRQAPVVLQVVVPVQVSASSAPATVAQVPVAQVWQVPAQVALQQCPSTHMPDVHSAPIAHVMPLALVVMQVVPEQK
jgi:hypothetical protein